MAVENGENVANTTFVWKLKYPFMCTNCDICSPDFCVDSSGIKRYYLNFVCKEIDEGNYNVSLLLKKHKWNSYPHAVTMNLKISIHHYNINEYYTLQHVAIETSTEIIFEKEISVANVTYLSIQSEITFSLEIETNLNFEDVEDLWTCNYEDLESLAFDIGNTLSDGKFADLTLESVDDNAITVHKAIFASRYSTLTESLDMFQNPKPKYLLELYREELLSLLRYLYSGKINKTYSNFQLLGLLNKAKLFHLEHILYSEPKIVHAATSVPLKYGSFVLIIPKFSELKNDTRLVNYLCCDALVGWTLLIIIFYIRETTRGEKYLTFKIQRVEQTGNLFGFCKISIISEEEDDHSYHLRFKSEGDPVLLSFVKVEEILEKCDSFLINDTLKLHFEVILSNLEVVSQHDSVEYSEVQSERFPSTAINLWALRKDIASLLCNPQFADITIQTEASLIPAHKVILSARSSVFSQISEEVEGNYLLIDKYDETVVLDMLSYIYSGDIKTESKSFEWAIDLYLAAKEYKIKKLQKKCCKYIKDNLNVDDNVSKLMERL